MIGRCPAKRILPLPRLDEQPRGRVRPDVDALAFPVLHHAVQSEGRIRQHFPLDRQAGTDGNDFPQRAADDLVARGGEG